MPYFGPTPTMGFRVPIAMVDSGTHLQTRARWCSPAVLLEAHLELLQVVGRQGLPVHPRHQLEDRLRLLEAAPRQQPPRGFR